MLEGSCLCGAVRYEILGEPGPAFFCHCVRCRKASGSAFASNAVIAQADFRFTRGQDQLRAYTADSGLTRHFCGECGSPLTSTRPGVPQVRVRLGTLDTPPAQGPQAHIFTAYKADWYDILDDRPQYPERPPV